MDKLALRRRHISTILRYSFVSVLGFFHLKNLFRKFVIKSKPVFKEDVSIFKNNRSLLVFPNIPWDYRWQRAQQIFSRLGEKSYNVFYLSSITSTNEYILEVSKGVYEIHVKASIETDVLRDLSVSEEMAKEIFGSIERLVGDYLDSKDLTFVLHPVWSKVVQKFKDRKVVYDMMDLYSGFSEAKPELVIAEELLVKESKLVLTTADNLYKYAKRFNSNVEMVRNGCDFERFSDIKKNGVLDSLDDRPIVGYFGALNDWLDVDALEYAVKENRDKYFVLIGSINTGKVKKLYRYSNVFFFGEVNHSELGGYLAYFDVCTIPFILNDLIKSTNPVKFYEYIASGKPVVSARLPELEIYKDICCLYDSSEDFSKCIYKGLHDEDKEIAQKRIEIAKENSWEKRIEKLDNIIKSI